MTESTKGPKIRVGIRFPKHESKVYYINLFQRFADHFDVAEVREVQFGKQDIRGTESITLVDHNHCVPKQIHFVNKYEMIGYIKGFCEASDHSGYSHLQRFLKAA